MNRLDPEADGRRILPAGFHLGRYEILEAIGSGGMGQVYRARDVQLQRDVALKVLPPGLTADPARRERFVQEARAASALEHPHIAVIHEIGDADGISFIAMELLRGESLEQLIARRALTPGRALDVAIEVAEGLARAHEAKIVHRDLKPANVMVSAAGHAKIIDFGLAKLIDALGTGSDAATRIGNLTDSHVVVGTPSYMSPEQASSGRVDQRSDIFSFGTMLHEMLTGQPPFRGRTSIETIHAIVYDPAPPLPIVLGPATADLQRVLDKCLAKDALDRYQGAADLIVDLRTARRRHESAETLPIGGGSVLLKASRYSRLALSIVALVVVGAGAVLWWYVQRTRSEHARMETIARAEHAADLNRFVDVWRIAQPALLRWPHDMQLERLAHATTDTVTIITDPAGAAVSFKAYDDVSGSWIPLGISPLKGVRAPLGMLRWRLEKNGFEPLEARLEVGAPAAAAGRPDVIARPIRLHPMGGEPAGMVFVPGGSESGIELTDYWIDRTEVTNQDFKTFVDRGGYDTDLYWTAVRGGPAGARESFRDRTGQPGPSTWELGSYPRGQEAYPVNGVSWFEARAYCQSTGKSLPTVHHWRRAFGAAFFMEVVTLGNFAGHGPESTTRLKDVGPYGTYGMAGNVKEWVSNAFNDDRYILGGAWNEPAYMAADPEARPPSNRADTNGIRCVKETAPSSAAAYAPPPAPRARDFKPPAPVDDTTFAVFRRFYSYDRASLDARVERSEDAGEWRRERVSFAAAYGGERVLANILLPKNVPPPYQAVVWFPGSYALGLSHSDGDLPFSYYFDFLPRSGRALVYPVYKATYERRVAAATGPGQYRDVIVAWSKDLGRTLDYLGTRTDFASDKIAYFGFSMGAATALPAVALEPRLKAVVLLAGGLVINSPSPEVDPVNFAPRITAPVLMLSGQYDFDFPVESLQKPLFALLGTPADRKKYVLFPEAGHVPPRIDVIRETLAWLDRYLGPVAHRQE